MNYDVDMSPREKEHALNRFDADESIFAMVLNFRSANVALNVQRATVAIMVEPSHPYSVFLQYFARIDRPFAKVRKNGYCAVANSP
jgi:SNF2 family DNA or RNA helicase